MSRFDAEKIKQIRERIGGKSKFKDDIFEVYDFEDIKGITLMHKNTPVLYFDNSREIRILNESLIPFQIKDVANIDLLTLQQFIKSRSISVRRKYYKDIVNYMGIQQEASEFAIMLKTQALSLQDHYWIKVPSNPNQKWEDINLFNNKFSEAIAFIAFTGSIPTIQNELKTPEIATGGVYPKCWVRDGNDIYLYKASLENGNETECEVFSSRVASFLSENALNYDFIIHENKRSSKCKIFTSLELEEVSASNLAKYLSRNDVGLIDFLLSEYRDYYFELLLVDSVVNNRDRHNSNFSFLYNEEKDLKPAPIFDLNNSMSIEDKTSLLDPNKRNNLEVLRELIKRKPVEEKVLNLRKAIDDGRLDRLNKDLIKYDSKLYNELKARLSWRLDSVLNKKDDMTW